jgi:hypothetical protein
VSAPGRDARKNQTAANTLTAIDGAGQPLPPPRSVTDPVTLRYTSPGRSGPVPGGSTIWLQIDETEFADTDEEAENTWLPVLAALQELLAASTRTNPATSTRKDVH